MSNTTSYDDLRALLRYGAVLAHDLNNHDLGHGIIDLCRRARIEISAIGIKGGGELPKKSYEGLLLYHLMPEIAYRLMQGSGAELLLLKEERSDRQATGISSTRLRHDAGICLEKGAFPLIAQKIRKRFDPDFRRKETFFANEALAQDVWLGNIVEIALNRIAPAPVNGNDVLSRLIKAHAKRHGSAHVSWAPDLPQYSQPGKSEDEIEVSRIGPASVITGNALSGLTQNQV